jgi:hypothetical protein
VPVGKVLSRTKPTGFYYRRSSIGGRELWEGRQVQIEGALRAVLPFPVEVLVRAGNGGK